MGRLGRDAVPWDGLRKPAGERRKGGDLTLYRGNDSELSIRMPAVLLWAHTLPPPLLPQGMHPHTQQHPHTPVPGAFGAGGGAQLVPGGTALRHAPAAAAGSWEALLGAAGAGDLAGLFGAAGGRAGDKAGAAPNAEINPVQVRCGEGFSNVWGSYVWGSYVWGSHVASTRRCICTGL